VGGTASGDLDFDACVIGARDATIGTAHNLGKTSGVLPSGSSPTPSASTSESIRDFRHRVF
jgi:hypothetical protein